ncbi:GAF domain-containing sensor histidine kinase [Rapidithrix thailandica]|uniref:histidine kinase n=1 Tax=Rapidithrix thailandica TaxID=413964 RepID=A0AAW9S0G5_9BACT
MERLVDTVQKLSLARNLETIMQIVRSAARKLTGADGATFVLREGDLCYYADEEAISPLWKGSRFPMNTCISGWVMLNKKPAVIEDIYKDDRIPADAYRPTFVKSLAMVPIRTLEPIGAIGNYWANYRMPTMKEVATLQALADITAVSLENVEVRIQLEEKLEERKLMIEQLERQKEQLEEFTHIIAHNIRAPLSNLLFLNNMLKESASIEKKLLYLEKQKPVIDFLNDTFEEVVDAIQVKTDFNVQREYLDMENQLQFVISYLQGEILEAKATITYDFSKVRKVFFPPKYLESIFMNLLSNALRYCSPKRLPEIHVRSYLKDGWVCFEIKDNGLGINLANHGEQVFKLHKTFHEHPKAKGFGLFITKTQVEAVGGSISLKSIPDEGSIFTLRLFKNR